MVGEMVARIGKLVKPACSGRGASIQNKVIDEVSESWIACRRNARISVRQVGIFRRAIIPIEPERIIGLRQTAVEIAEHNEGDVVGSGVKPTC